MSKNTRNRILLTAVAALLLVCVAVGGTLAWLTAKSNEVENTFVTTTIAVELKEHEVKKDETTGALETDKTKEVEANTDYIMQPGLTMDKDPFARMTTGNGYVFIEIVTQNTVGEGEGAVTYDADTYLNWNVKGMWDEVENATGPNGGKVYGYKGTVDATNLVAVTQGTVTESIIDTITVDSSLTNSQVADAENVKLTFYAYAIQSDNLAADTAENIWSMYMRDDEDDTTTYTASTT